MSYAEFILNKTFDGGEMMSIIQTPDGGFAILGDTESKGAGYEDVWLIRTDKNGNLLWDKHFISNPPESIIQTQDGRFAIVGETKSKDASDDDLDALDVWFFIVKDKK